ncbi:MAG: ester cyclase [Ktedonobacteraceae bacterium]|nr:ester cyclase [Ktedonobacteraceae bacterium]
MLPEERKAIARLAHEAINQRNLALLEGHPGYWQTRQVFPMLFTSFPDASSTIEQQTVEGTWVTTRTTLRGTHLGAFMGVAPTGKAIEIMNISLDQVEEGKLVEHFGVSDWLQALIAFEIMSAPTSVTSEATR